MKAVEVSQLRKVFEKENIVAVNDVNFSVNAGELFGIIGPDGAGKTTLFRMLTTLLLPDRGNAWVNGFEIVKDYKEIRYSIGYMPGRFSLYQDLTIEENLNFFATLFGTSVKENYDLVKDIYVQIERFKDRRAGKLSGGMKQKLALCCALIHRPKVLFLDEPTTGVDPVSRKEFWDMLKRLKDQGIAIVVSTPYMDEATRCDRIALFQSGTILSSDTPQNIIAAYPDPLYAVKVGNMNQTLNALAAFHGTTNYYAFGEFAHATFKDGITIADVVAALKNSDTVETIVKPVTPTIEDCFIRQLSNPL